MGKPFPLVRSFSAFSFPRSYSALSPKTLIVKGLPVLRRLAASGGRLAPRMLLDGWLTVLW